MPNASFADQIIAGKFARVLWVYHQATGWVARGTEVRGELVLVDLGAVAAIAALDFEMQRRNLHPATAYELVHFASHGWNGEDTVIAFGSSIYKQLLACAA